MSMNLAALSVGQRAQRLAEDFYSLLASLVVAADPRAETLAPAILPGQVVPVGTVKRQDDTEHVYHFVHFLSRTGLEPLLQRDFERTWMAGAILQLGDALALEGYFDHAPELELVYHLRNGIAHGNRFRLTQGGIVRLQKYPAHNLQAEIRGDRKSEFTITSGLVGQVLFTFMGPGDVMDLIMSVGHYLITMGNGESPLST
jgi:hypothetical protein